ncbi:MAG: ArdC family protein [Cyanobacteriota bacterium]|jgi:antirestriction protein ArdC
MSSARITSDQRLVDSLMAAMATGISPWRRPWDSDGLGHHVNLISGRRYRGANPILLSLGLHQRQSNLPFWCGFGEARAAGLSPRRGSRAVVVLRPQVQRRQHQPSPPPHPTSDEPVATGPAAVHSEDCWVRYRPLPVFNAADLVGESIGRLIEQRRHSNRQQQRPEPERLATAESVLRRWPVPVCHGGDRAAYQPVNDRILLPDLSAFHTSAAYYATWAHEAIHSTGHPCRLNRDLSGRLEGTTEECRAYAREELVAELGAVLLGDRLEIGSDVNHHAAYLDHWIRLLSESPTVLYRVLSDARRAADGIAAEQTEQPLEEAPVLQPMARQS